MSAFLNCIFLLLCFIAITSDIGTAEAKKSLTNRVDKKGRSEKCTLKHPLEGEKKNKPPKQICLPELPSTQPWYNKSTLDSILIYYYNANAKNPYEEMKKVKPEFIKDINLLETRLRGLGWCKKVEYTGSSYEGLKISEDGLEFDVMFVIDGTGLELVPVKGQEGYTNFKASTKALPMLQKSANFTGLLSPTKVNAKFFGTVTKWKNDVDPTGQRMKLRNHGPATQMDVFNGTKKVWYSVDLVPAVEIKDAGEVKLYIPKPLKNVQTTWRRSFSREEKRILKTLDQGNGCRRKVARVIKAMFKGEPTLRPFTSYYIKTTLLLTVQSFPDMSWKTSDVTERVLDVLGAIEFYLKQRYLPHYFIPSINLLVDMKEHVKLNMLKRVRSLRRYEDKFVKAIDLRYKLRGETSGDEMKNGIHVMFAIIIFLKPILSIFFNF